MSSEDIQQALPVNETNEKSDKVILIVDDDRDIGDVLQQIIVDQTDYKALWIAESELALNAAPLCAFRSCCLTICCPLCTG